MTIKWLAYVFLSLIVSTTAYQDFPVFALYLNAVVGKHQAAARCRCV